MTIRFNKHFWVLGVCAAMGALPAASHAKQDAIDNCIQAFVAEQLPLGHKIEVVKRQPSRFQLTSTRPTTIKVQAKGKRSGTEYGSAVCEMSRKGEVVAMVVKGERTQFANASQPKAHGG